jgi:hypothetical protein
MTAVTALRLFSGDPRVCAVEHTVTHVVSVSDTET